MPTTLGAALQLADEQRRAGDRLTAELILSAISREYPRDCRAALLEGQLQQASGNMAAARASLRAAALVDPRDRDIRRALVACGSESDRPIMLDLPPLEAIGGERPAISTAALGHLFSRQCLWHQAAKQLAPLWTHQPERLDVGVALAEALWHMDEADQAQRVCREVLEASADCLAANLILGQLLTASGAHAEAAPLLATAQAVDPENVVAQELYDWLRVRDPALAPLGAQVVPLEETWLAPRSDATPTIGAPELASATVPAEPVATWPPAAGEEQEPEPAREMAPDQPWIAPPEAPRDASQPSATPTPTPVEAEAAPPIVAPTPTLSSEERWGLSPWPGIPAGNAESADDQPAPVAAETAPEPEPEPAAPATSSAHAESIEPAAGLPTGPRPSEALPAEPPAPEPPAPEPLPAEPLPTEPLPAEPLAAETLAEPAQTISAADVPFEQPRYEQPAPEVAPLVETATPAPMLLPALGSLLGEEEASPLAALTADSEGVLATLQLEGDHDIGRSTLEPRVAEEWTEGIDRWTTQQRALAGRLGLGELLYGVVESDRGALHLHRQDQRTTVALTHTSVNVGLVRVRLRRSNQPPLGAAPGDYVPRQPGNQGEQEQDPN